jgi:hypothetical protein
MNMSAHVKERPLVLKDNQLAIPADYNTYTLADIFEQARDKFGKTASLDDFTIEIERYQARGCLCCNDNSDYDLYFVITYNPQG